MKAFLFLLFSSFCVVCTLIEYTLILLVLFHYNFIMSKYLYISKVTFYFHQKHLFFHQYLYYPLQSNPTSDIIHLCLRFFQSVKAVLISTFYSLELFDRCGLYLLNCSKMTSFHGSFQFWKKEIVGGVQIWWIRWLSNDYGGKKTTQPMTREVALYRINNHD